MTLITILGPTAVGKTSLSAKLAKEIGGEVISADSRQVYRGMNIGSGKDLADFNFGNETIPYHLIDICEAGEEYNVFEFQRDFYAAYREIVGRGATPILCGGTGMYLQAALDDFQLIQVPKNESLRAELEAKTQNDLIARLYQLRGVVHNSTDLVDRERTIRAIEIEEAKSIQKKVPSPVERKLIFGIQMERKQLRERIANRLQQRLEVGMIEEVKVLVSNGISHSQLQYYGLEYKFISLHLEGKLTYDEMHTQLLQAIRRFAKKQLTWFRRMEKKGVVINWLSADLTTDEKLKMIKEKTNGSREKI